MQSTGAPKNPGILAYFREAAEAERTAQLVREALHSTVVGGGLTLLTATPGPLLAALPAGIIWDLRAASLPSLAAIVRQWTSRRVGVPPILARVDLAEVGARQLIKLVRDVPFLRLSARGSTGFEDDVIDWLSMPGQPTAEQAIIDRLAKSPLTSPIGVAIQAAVAARRHMSVHAFADAIGIPLRTMQSRLRDEGFPQAWQLLGMSVSLHAFWRLEVRRWPLKQVAISLGFESAQSLAGHLERHIGRRPRALLEHEDFETALDAYVRRLASSPGTG